MVGVLHPLPMLLLHLLQVLLYAAQLHLSDLVSISAGPALSESKSTFNVVLRCKCAHTCVDQDQSLLNAYYKDLDVQKILYSRLKQDGRAGNSCTRRLPKPHQNYN